MLEAPYLWQRYKAYLCEAGGLSLDVSRMHFPDGLFLEMEANVQRAFQEMDALETGAMANPDEGRMVGHYWLRKPELAPDPERQQIEAMQQQIDGFVQKNRNKFDRFLLIGIGGSALGPQFVADALGSTGDGMAPHFFDNTDPDGMDRVLKVLGAHGGLEKTLAVVISKSGSTPETRNGMLEAMQAYDKAGVSFADHAVAVTGEGSKLYNAAEGWLERFPMWDWVGGRTSVTSAVGLLPMRLQGIDAEALLAGAAEMDEATRTKDPLRNPAMLLALMWHYAGNGRGEKNMVVLPYADRLVLFSKYLQQLVMESLGKETDRTGWAVNQGLTVYGNKGSTDQHAYIQQLREGRNDFFATFINVLEKRQGESPNLREFEVDEEGNKAEGCATSGDYLNGFLLGTRQALYDNQRESVTITMERVDAANVGRLIALFERAVGFYASLININAYHQPGVEAGKDAAKEIVKLQDAALHYLEHEADEALTPSQLAAAIGAPHEVETLYHILRHLAANGRVTHHPGPTPFEGSYGAGV
jgi:glucose-6-phosphate isomerase